MVKLRKRQQKILEFIRRKNSASNKEIREYFQQNVSKPTINRDLDFLSDNRLIKKTGQGRSVRYQENIQNELLRYIDAEAYFLKTPDERPVAFPRYNFHIYKNLKNIFTATELAELKKLNLKYKKNRQKLSKTALRKEIERLTIELSWKSSRIEGNTYSLIDTEILIKEREEAAGHQKEEAIMILNHKKAIDYIFNNPADFKKLDIRKIENVHYLLAAGLKVSKGLRQGLVGIVGTRYKPLDNQYQIREALQKTIKIINQAKNPFAKALLAILMISYIQPFEDGNKRAARVIGDAVLLAHNICPLSYRSVNESDYKKAMIIFYEQNNFRAFKELFVEQFKFAVENYF